MQEPRSIVITGASSGIGEALARHYAASDVALALTGRDAARLAAVADACRERGADVRSRLVDTTDREAMAAWLAEIDAAKPIDLLIANAGISGGTGGTGEALGESAGQTRRIFAVNLDGVLNSVLPVLPPMRARRRGQIALMSSLAAFRGFPGAPAYCASKAAVRVWGEALRGELQADGVEVSVICPGFVVSRMTAVNRFRMPLLMSAERAAAVIARGLARNRARIAFPLPMYVGSWLLGALPPWLTAPLLRRLPKKA